MRFRIVPLEERIVLDAAAIVDAAAPPTTAQADAAHIINDSSALPIAPTDPLHMMDASQEASAPVSLLVISSDVKDAHILAQAARDPSHTIVYDAKTSTLDSLLAEIRENLNGQKADTIAIATNGTTGAFQLANGVAVSAETLDASPELRDFWTELSTHLNETGQVDLLACRVAEGPSGDALMRQLDALMAVKVAASTDVTANLAQGGNWYLEEGQVDASALFYSEALSQWTGSLDTPVINLNFATSFGLYEDTTSSNVPIFGNITVTVGGGHTITSTVLTESHGTIVRTGSNTSFNFTYTADPGYNGPDTVTITATDSGGDVGIATISVNVASVNDAPSGGNSIFALNEDVGRIFSAADFNFTDPNDGLPGNAVPANTLLGVKISSISGATSTFTNNGAAITVGQTISIADINAGNFRFTPAANANGSNYASFNFQVQDNGGVDAASGGTDLDPTPNFIRFDLTAVNDAPVVTVPGAQIATEEISKTISGISFSDVDNGSGNATVTLSTAHGNLSMSSTVGLGTSGLGSHNVTLTGTLTNLNNAFSNLLTYTPDANFNDTDSISVTINDQGNTGSGGALSDSKSIGITVNPVNDAPSGANNTVTTNEDTDYQFNIQTDFGFNDSVDSPHSNNLAGILITTTPNVGQLFTNGINPVSAGQFIAFDALLRYVPVANGNGSSYASFTFQVRDDSGAANNTDPTPNTMTINVNAVNDAPVVTVPGLQTVTEDISKTISGISFSDVDNGSGDATVTLSTAHGNLNLSSTVGLGTLGLGSHNVTLTGTLTSLNNAFSNFTYAPDADFNGSDSISVTMNDQGNTGSGGAKSDSKSIAITINPTNDPPSGANNTVTTNEDTDYHFNIQTDFGVGFSDSVDSPNSNNFAGIVITTTPTVGQLYTDSLDPLTAGQFLAFDAPLRYVPVANGNGSSYASFTFQVRDDSGAANNTDPTPNTMTINVNAVNDAPVVTVPGAQTTNEDISKTISGISFSDVDSETGLVTLNTTIGILNLNNFNPSLFFSSGLGTGHVEIFGFISDLNNAFSNGLIFSPNSNYFTNNNPNDSISVTFSDQSVFGPDGTTLSDSESIAITINPVNDAPVANNDSYSGDEDLQITGNVLANDTDVESAITAIKVSDPQHGSVVLLADGSFTYTPNPNYFGSDSFTYKANDGTQDSAPATVNFTINPVSDASTITVPGPQTTNEDIPLPISGISFSDADGNVPGYVVITNPHGTFSISNTSNLVVSGIDSHELTLEGTINDLNNALSNNLIFTPDPNLNGNTLIIITISDPNDQGLLFDDKNIAVTINPVNDAPSGADNTITIDEDTPYIFNPLADFGFSDVDSNNYGAVLITSTPTSGQLFMGTFLVHSGFTIPSSSLLRYVPDANGNGSPYATFTFQVRDDSGAANNTDPTFNTMTINVNAVNDVPTVTVPGPQTTNEDIPIAISGISFSDADGNVPAYVLITDPQGTFSISNTSNLVVSGIGSDYLTLEGTINDLNNALALSNNLIFTPNPHLNGNNFIFITIYDPNDFSIFDYKNIEVTINSVNDAPVANDDNDSTNEDTPVTINVLANDTDVESNTLTPIILSSSGGTAIVNANGTVTFSPLADINGLFAFTYKVNDGFADSNEATVVVNILPINDAPVVTVPGATSTNEDISTTILGISFSDVDISDGSGQASVTLSAANGSLSMSDAPGLSISGSGHSITLTGLFDDFNPAFSNGLIYNPDLNYNGPDSISVTMNDLGNAGSGGAKFDTESIDITVNALNDPPVANNDSFTVNEDVTIDGNVFANNGFGNDTDVDGDGFTAIPVFSVGGIYQGPNYGTLNFNTFTGDFNYVPSHNFTGTDQFAYKLTDGLSFSDVAIVTLNFLPVNDPPSANPDSVTTDEETPIDISISSLLANDTDVDGDVLSSLLITLPPSNGILTFNFFDLSYIYTPNLHYNGTDSFKYKAQDPSGALSNEATVTITINSINDTPVANNDSASTDEDTSVTINVLANDTDVESNTLTPIIVGSFGGTATVNADRTVTFAPLANINGPAAFTYKVNDGLADSNVATVLVNIAPVNDAPVVTVPGAQITDEDTSTTILGISFEDVDSFVGSVSGQAEVTLSAAHGSLSMSNASGLTVSGSGHSITLSGPFGNFNSVFSNGLIYSPDLNYNGPDSISVTMNDLGNTGSGGAQSDSKSIAITVNPIYDAPVANNDNASTFEDTPVTINVLANDTYVESSTLTPIIVTSSSGTATVNANGTVTFAPLDNLNGFPIIFTYKVNDGFADSNVATVLINVISINDAPVVTVPGAQITDEDTSKTISGISFSDVDNGIGIIQGHATVTLSAAHGSLSMSNAPGLTISGSGHSITLEGNFTNFNPAFLNGLIYSPDLNYNGPDSISVTMDDLGNTGSGGAQSDSKSIAITVNPIYDAPVANNDNASTFEDTSITINVLANDTYVESSTLTPIIVASSAGTAIVNANGTVTFTPLANINGLSAFTYKVNDGLADSNVATVSVNVISINDAPVVTVPGAQITNEDTSKTISGISFSDVDNGIGVIQGQARVTLSAAHGSLSMSNAPGLTISGSGHSITLEGNFTNFNPAFLNGLIYSPDLNYNGPDSISVTMDDLGNTGFGGPQFDTESIAITVNPLVAPVANNDSASGDEDTSITGNVLANDTDANNDTLTAIKVSDPLQGSVILLADGSFTYTPNANYNGSDSFTYKANDSLYDSNIATVTLNIAPVGDAPSGTDIEASIFENQNLGFAAGSFGFSDPIDSPPNNFTGIIISNFQGGGTLTYNGIEVEDGQFIPVAGFSGLIYTPGFHEEGDNYASFAFQVRDDGTVNNTDLSANTVTIDIIDQPVLVTAYAQPNSIEIGRNISTNVALATFIDPAGPESLSHYSATIDWGDGSSLSSGIITGGLGPFTVSGSHLYSTLGNYSPIITIHHDTATSVQVTLSNSIDVINNAPAAVDDSYSGNEDISIVGNVLSNDTDPNGDSLSILSYIGPAHGTLTMSLDGSFTYAPNANYYGPDSFTYTARDSFNSPSNSATVSISVASVNDAPVANNDSASGNEDTQISGNVLANDTDVESALTAIKLTDPLHGSVTLNADGSFTYTPNANYNGSDSFTYKANDGTADSGIATVYLTINSVNDAPSGANNTVTTNEDTPYIFTSADFGFSDPNDSPANNLYSVIISTSPSAGTLRIDTDVVGTGDEISKQSIDEGRLTFTPAANANGNGYANFTFQVLDDGGGALNALDPSPNTMTINVTSVNDAPSGADATFTMNQNTSYTLTAANFGFSDPSDSPANSLLAVRITTLPGAGSLTNNNVAVIAGQFISLADISGGNLKFTPAANANGSNYANFTFQVQDDGGTTPGVDLDQSPNTITFNVSGTNTAPVSVNDSYSTNEDTVLNIAGPGVLANDTDAQGNALNAVLVTAPTKGTLVLNSDGSFTYTPNANIKGTDTFKYKANDGLLSSSNTATVTLTINSVNDAPSGTDKTITMNEDATYTFAVANFGFTDTADSNALLAVKITTLSGASGLQLNGVAVTADQFIAKADISGGLLKFVPAPGTNGMGYANFTFQVQDNGGTANGGVDLDQSPNTMTINVTAVNDAPVITAPTSETRNEDTPIIFNDISVFDLDAGSGLEKITIKDTHGNLTLASTAGLTVTGNGTSLVTAIGMMSDLNAALAGLQYTPTANYNGTDSIILTLNDQGNTGSGTAKSDTHTISINLIAVDDIPIAVDDAYSAVSGVLLNVGGAGVLANDSDVETALTAVLLNGPAFGTLNLNADGSFSYTANTGISGTDSFSYKANDGAIDSNIATVTIIVAPNQPPTINVGTALRTYTENAIPVIVAPTVSLTDPDTPIFNNGQLIVTIAQNGSANDILSIQQTAAIVLSGSDIVYNGVIVGTYSGGDVVNPLIINFNGNATKAIVANIMSKITFAVNSENPTTLDRTITFVVSDGQGNNSNIGTKTVAVVSVNDAPVNSYNTDASSRTVVENATTNIGQNLSLSFTDADSAANNSYTATFKVTTGFLNISSLVGILADPNNATERSNFFNGVDPGTAGLKLLTLKGTLEQIGLAMERLTYTLGSTTATTDSLVITTTDSGGSINGGVKKDTDTISLLIVE